MTLLKAKYVSRGSVVEITQLNDGVPPDDAYFKSPTYFVYDVDDSNFKIFLPAKAFHRQYQYKYPEDLLNKEIERKDNA